jgi:tRNA A-37 threonylcarbamoyl transferase component Bud32
LTHAVAHGKLASSVLVQEGQSFGNFQVIARLGSGGMGSVFLAEHARNGKRVAIKLIHAELARSDEVRERFMREARAVNQIGNEHIVEVFDDGVTGGGEPFLVMEYIHGRTLAEVIAEQGALPVPRALHMAEQLAQALAAAHAVGIVHRDLKPDNVMLTARLGDPDFVKILDFGLAKMLAGNDVVSLTAHGVVLGTPHFMAPEVCEGRKPIDHRADIYGFGVLMFLMMTGRLPFDAPSMGGVLIKQVTEPPPAPRGFHPGIPPSVEQIILRCLAKPPEARFQSMDELRHALLDPERYLATGPPVMPATSPDPHAGALPMDVPDTQISMPPVMQPNMQWPVAPPVNRTMPIGMPIGGREVVRRRWLLGVVLAVAALAGAAVALVVADEPAAEVAGPDAAGLLADAGAQVALPGDESDARLGAVTVRLTTRPEGAEVFDQHGTLLGKTPTDIELPRDGREHVLEFRHPRAETRRKTVVASGDAEFELELTPVAPGDADEDHASDDGGKARGARGRRPRTPGRRSLDL